MKKLLLIQALLRNYNYIFSSTCNVTINQNMDIPHDEEKEDTLFKAADDLPPETNLTKKRGLSKSRSVADVLMNKSDERNSLIKKIMD